jgi:hypothetical protein
VERTATQTVLLAIALLCAMGCVCSLTTKSLHAIVMWFAPINGMRLTPDHSLAAVVDIDIPSACVDWDLHRLTGSYAR